jgi:hypothetical protein
MSLPVRVEEEIAVFGRGTRVNGIPSCRMDRIGAQYLVDCGFAKWVNNRYKSILMLIEAANFKARDRSCSMGPRVIELAAMGNFAAVALVMGWTPAMIPSAIVSTLDGESYRTLTLELDEQEREQMDIEYAAA